MHNGFINVDNQKMSKSLHNFFTVRDVADVYGYEPIRYFMLTAGYRMPLNYTVDLIESCKKQPGAPVHLPRKSGFCPDQGCLWHRRDSEGKGCRGPHQVLHCHGR